MSTLTNVYSEFFIFNVMKEDIFLRFSKTAGFCRFLNVFAETTSRTKKEKKEIRA